MNNAVVNKWTAILLSSAIIAASAASYIFFTYQKNKKRITGKRNKKRGSVNIGGCMTFLFFYIFYERHVITLNLDVAIFGMDVGGTLTKIVYFEAKREEEPSNIKSKIISPEL